MIRGIAEVIGWLLIICVLGKAVGLLHFHVHISTTLVPPPEDCPVDTPPKAPNYIHMTTHTITPAAGDRRFTPIKPGASLDYVIAQMKREARRLSKTTSMTHSQALEHLARQNGFKTYAALRAAAKELA